MRRIPVENNHNISNKNKIEFTKANLRHWSILRIYAKNLNMLRLQSFYKILGYLPRLCRRKLLQAESIFN